MLDLAWIFLRPLRKMAEEAEKFRARMQVRERMNETQIAQVRAEDNTTTNPLCMNNGNNQDSLGVATPEAAISWSPCAKRKYLDVWRQSSFRHRHKALEYGY